MRPATSGPARRAVGRWLRRLADRIDWYGAPRSIGWSFTFEDHRGIVFREHNHGPDRRGCQLWYIGEDDYRRAHDDAEGAAVSVVGRRTATTSDGES